jgi:hypothetical protein
MDLAPQVIFANTCNRLMIEALVAEHSGGLSRAGPRKLWLARPGDLLVTLGTVSPAMRRHAAELLGHDEAAIEVLELPPAVPALLAERVAADPLALARLRARADGPTVLSPYALDQPTWAMARTLGLRLASYESTCEQQLVSLVASLNRKSKFRELAATLDLPVVPGSYCPDDPALLDACDRLLRQHESVLVKLDRSSNGYGQLRLQQADRDRLPTRIATHAQQFAAQPRRTVVEVWLELRSAPSVELRVDDTGVSVLYDCDQVARGPGSAAMVTPSRTLTPRARATMLAWGTRLGEHLHAAGYRGVFDLDLAWTTDEQLYVSEANVRRTAGTHLHELVQRLRGSGSAQTCWLGDARPGEAPISFAEGLRALEHERLAYRHEQGHGVLLTTDGVEHDGRWRYLIVGNSPDHVDALEARLAGVLSFRTRIS